MYCATCKHWEVEERLNEEDKTGLCKLGRFHPFRNNDIPETKKSLCRAFADDGCEPASLETHETFGCVQYEKNQ